MLAILSGVSIAQTTMNRSVSMETIEKESLQPKDEVWVLDFWASWCGPCIQSMPHLKEVYAKYKSQGVKFISLSHDRSADAWERTVVRLNMEWPQLLLSSDVDQTFVNKHFPHPYIPTLFVIDKKGKAEKVMQVHELEKHIQKAMAH